MDQDLVMPVAGATSGDWNEDTFWFSPWGESGVHKGIDIFSPRGTPVLAAEAGMVLSRRHRRLGGKVVAVLGPKWRVHYYAHLDSINVHLGEFIVRGRHIGTVGNSGNALGKLPHLHYSIVSLVPRFSSWSSESQGWKRVFYLDPSNELTN